MTVLGDLDLVALGVAHLDLALAALNPDCFSHDFTLIEEAGLACDEKKLQAAIVEFYRETGHTRSYLHNQLRFRVSGRRLLDLAEVCWEAAENHASGS